PTARAGRFDAFRPALPAGEVVYHIVDAFAFECCHRLELYRLAVLLDLLRGVLRDGRQLLTTVRAVPAHVEQQPARGAGLAEHGQPGQLLKPLQRHTPPAPRRPAPA